MELARGSGCLYGMNESAGSSYDGNLAIQFQADELADYEFRRTGQRRTLLDPEKRLMFAVLEDAIACFQRFIDAKGRKEKQLHQNAVAWIFESDNNRIFSFESVCEACGLNPQFLRAGLRRWSERNRVIKYSGDTAQRTSKRWRQRTR